MPDTIVGSNGRAHPVYSRDEWGARSPKRVVRMGPPQRLFVHYTVTPAHGTHPTLAQGIASMRSVQAFHMDVRGWSDFAYSYGVDNAGRVYVGRGPGVVGGHTQGWNSRSYAVVWIGEPGDEFTEDAKSGIRATLEHLDRLYSTRSTTYGHRDVGSTACPGDPAYAWVKAGMPLQPNDPIDPEELTMADIAAILAAQAKTTQAVEALTERVTALEAEVKGLHGAVDLVVGVLATRLGSAAIRVKGKDAIHVLRFDAVGPFLCRLTPEQLTALQEAGDVDKVITEATGGFAAQLATMRGFDAR